MPWMLCLLRPPGSAGCCWMSAALVPACSWATVICRPYPHAFRTAHNLRALQVRFHAESTQLLPVLCGSFPGREGTCGWSTLLCVT